MKKKNIKFKNQFSGGFTLIETLVAISIFTMSILGMMSILASGISDTGYAKKKMEAAYLAQEGIEYLRNQRDTMVLSTQGGWDEFNKDESDITGAPSFEGEGVFFTRTLSKEYISSDEAKISSTVEWAQGSGNYEVMFTEELFNWIE